MEPVLISVGRDRVILKEGRYPAVPESEEPFIGRDVLAVNGARELVELFVVNLGQYRNIAKRGSRVGRAPFAASAHEAAGMRRHTIPAG